MQQQMSIEPANYRITIEPDMENSRFSARLELAVFAAEKTTSVQLNSIDLSITRCLLGGMEKNANLGFQIDPADETLTIFMPEPISGDFELIVDYYGEISDSMAGFYKSRYRLGDQTQVIAVTQFQESDARRVFPCIDHPLHKATFEFVLIVDPHLTPLSNMLALSESYLKNGKKQVEFQKTPVMSTYLLFFGIGEFTIKIDDLDRRVRAAILPGMEEQVHYGLAFARKSLHYCEKYYRINFPLPKIDLIAVPDFAFGAMENWGAITFRENLLLYDPKNTDAESEERICEVIAHEMAHQWFGNLVTPSDWKYLWLNESFATYFGYGVIDHYHADWQIWDNFIESQVEPAMNRDALTDTPPIEIASGDHIVINSSTAPIIYSKGASILRQIASFTGEKVFADGLCKYLETHAYGCAKSADLWDALESVSDKPVSRIMEKWVKQAGHPLVTVTRAGNTLQLSQQRFSFLPSKAEATVWPIPMVIRVWDDNGDQRVIAKSFSEEKMEIELDADVAAYSINDSHAGFYRSHYKDPANWKKLCQMIESGTLPAQDRHGIVSDRFALLKAGMLDVGTFIGDLDHFTFESDPLPLSAIFDNLFLLSLVLIGDACTQAEKAMKALLEKTFTRIGYLPEKNDDHGVLRLKNKILWYGTILEMTGPSEVSAEQFEQLTSGRSVSPDITRAVLQGGALINDYKAFDWFVQRLETTPVEHERQNIIRAMGCFSQPDLIEKAKEYILTDVPQRNMHLPVAWLSMNPHAKDTLWDWFTKNIKRLEKIHPIIFERIISVIAPNCNMERHAEIKSYLDLLAEEKPVIAPATRMSLEKREVYYRLRNNQITSVG